MTTEELVLNIIKVVAFTIVVLYFMYKSEKQNQREHEEKMLKEHKTVLKNSRK